MYVCHCFSHECRRRIFLIVSNGRMTEHYVLVQHHFLLGKPRKTFVVTFVFHSVSHCFRLLLQHCMRTVNSIVAFSDTWHPILVSHTPLFVSVNWTFFPVWLISPYRRLFVFLPFIGACQLHSELNECSKRNTKCLSQSFICSTGFPLPEYL